jgi:hypothetical protein
LTHVICCKSVWVRILLLVLLTLAGATGVEWREAVWDWSAPARFTGDINNALHQGDRVVKDAGGTDASLGQLWSAYVGRYEKIADATPDGRVAHLDYPPVRLLIATMWSFNTRNVHGPGGYRDERAGFMMSINYVCEVVAALGILWLVRSVMVRAGRSVRASEIMACACAMLFWLNPALIQNAHAWPQWDVWLVPFYVLACGCIVNRCGWIAGALLLAGSMMKGQLLIVVPVMLAWPMLARDIRTAVGVLAGFLCAGAIMLSPWMIRGSIAWAVVVIGVVIAAGLTWWPVRRKTTWSTSTRVWTAGIVASFVLALLSFIVGTRLGGTMAWLEVGFPTTKYPTMALGQMHNLAAILAQQWGWQLDSQVSIFGIDGPMRSWLIRGFILFLVIATIGLAWSSRRRSVNVLMGVVVPWLLLFALLPQMHERYLMWAAVLSCVLVAVRPAWIVVHLVLTVQSVALMSVTQFSSSGQSGMIPPGVWSLFTGLGPWAGYATITMALFMLASSFPGPKVIEKSEDS